MDVDWPPSHEDSGSNDDRVMREGVPSVLEVLARVAELLARVHTGAKDFLLVEELAEQLRVTPRAVRQMMDRGELPWAPLGRRRVIPRAALLTMLADQARRNEPARWPR